ncbi:unnamed protein product [Cylindrotheca closterium]|uniref:Uncharacterized protein n=1 Tax=Cylindrotheca closterium TaxID=2856 RepID=A0AAD2JK48_9STRA|nr:unnamed protein product [Cylindrotheca closterium]
MTEAVISLKTDMSIATDKNTTITGVTSDTSVTSMKPIAPDEELSLNDPTDVGDIFPPLKIHASRPTERLSGSSFDIPPRLEKALRRKSGGGTSGTKSPYDGGSSISSLEDAGFDTDILTDKMGHLDLDASSSKLNHSASNSLHLHTVAERLSDETLEDTHAFTDIKSRGSVSRGNSITTGGEVAGNFLEPLDEIDEETEGAVKITNMGEILEVAEEDTANDP